MWRCWWCKKSPYGVNDHEHQESIHLMIIRRFWWSTYSTTMIIMMIDISCNNDNDNYVQEPFCPPRPALPRPSTFPPSTFAQDLDALFNVSFNIIAIRVTIVVIIHFCSRMSTTENDSSIIIIIFVKLIIFDDLLSQRSLQWPTAS